MMVKQTRYTPQGGWNPPLPLELDSERTLVLAFAAPQFGATLWALEGLLRAFPRSHKLGCSTAGEIAGAEVLDGSIVVAIARFEKDTALRVAHAVVERAQRSRASGEQLAAALIAPDLRAILVLSEGIEVNGSALVQGLRAGLPAGVAVVGGLAGDAKRFECTWVLSERGALTHHASAVGFYGPHLRVGYGSAGGWNNCGVERRVTRAQGNVLYELDGRPALALYKEYLAERAAELPLSGLLCPLGLRSGTDDTRLIVRTLLGTEESSQSLRFAGDVPQGALAQLMRTSSEHLIQGAEMAGREAAAACARETPQLAVAVSGVGRRLMLGPRTGEEVEAVLQMMPKNTVQIGFYSYGEVAPTAGGLCDLQQQTMSVTTLGEA